MEKYIQGKNQSERFNALHLLQLDNRYVLLAEYHYLQISKMLFNRNIEPITFPF
jgi:hypothetical protein